MKKIFTILLIVFCLSSIGYAQSLSAFGEGNTVNFAVSPNPASNSFTLLYDYDRDSYVEIYNVLGVVVARVKPETEFDALVDCSNWQNGYYICKLINKQKVQRTLKLVIAR